MLAGPGLELELESIEQCDTPRPLRLLIVVRFRELRPFHEMPERVCTCVAG